MIIVNSTLRALLVSTNSYPTRARGMIKQLLDEVEHDIMNYQNRGLCSLPKPKAKADFDNS